jgi:hypothetical protein
MTDVTPHREKLDDGQVHRARTLRMEVKSIFFFLPLSGTLWMCHFSGCNAVTRRSALGYFYVCVV